MNSTSKPWEAEPDEMDFEAHDLLCALRRGPTGAWCGYVGIGEGHPLHGKDYSTRIHAPKHLLERPVDNDRISVISMFCAQASELEDGIVSLDLCFDVHGGLTWANPYAGGPAHKDKNLWWFGFDCGHAGDLCPKYEAGQFGHEHYAYRDIAYAENDCRDLARQLAEWPRAEIAA